MLRPLLRLFSLPPSDATEGALNESEESPKLLLEGLGSGGVKHETKASATVLAAILTGFLPGVDLFEDVVVEE